jgi:hypothetical protein
MVVATLLTPALAGAAKPAVTASRGELLYENHCTSCHTSIAHLRTDRRANSVAAVEAWVRRWSGELKLGWGDEEVQAVVRHLAQRYYKFEVAPERN